LIQVMAVADRTADASAAARKLFDAKDGPPADIWCNSGNSVVGKEWIEIQAAARVVIEDFRSAEMCGKALWEKPTIPWLGPRPAACLVLRAAVQPQADGGNQR
jgi:hypothetical protein